MPGRRGADPGGKLKAAARRWAGGRGGPAIPADDALTAASRLPARRATDSDEAIELPPDQRQAVALFLTLNTQWRRHATTGMRLGIDYAAIEPAARMMEFEMTPALLSDIRTMERAALEELHK